MPQPPATSITFDYITLHCKHLGQEVGRLPHSPLAKAGRILLLFGPPEAQIPERRRHGEARRGVRGAREGGLLNEALAPSPAGDRVAGAPH